MSKLEVGVRYVVTKEHPFGSFCIGDHIRLEPNGDVLCREAGGWIPMEDLGDELDSLEVAIDREWYEKRLIDLRENDVAEIERILKLQGGTPAAL